MAPKKPKTGILLLLTALGAGGAGFLLGRSGDGDAPPARAPTTLSRGSDLPTWDELPEESYLAPPTPTAAEELETPAAPVDLPHIQLSELYDRLRGQEASPHSQKALLGLVADSALAGPARLAELRALLESGVDLQFPSYREDKPGYPSLRVALLAAAEATGEPAATEMIAEVARTTENPVEMIFSAHLLDRLDALDAATAQRTLDALAQPLTAEQRKAMSSVARQVVSAAAAADPGYAETYLLTQIRRSDGPRTDPRLLAPILDGLPADRAQEVVFSTLTAADVHDRAKGMLAGRAAQRAEVEVLASLRRTIESGAVSPQVSTTIARSAMNTGTYGRIEHDARKKLKSGDLAGAQGVAREYETRLTEAARTLTAATAHGANLPRDLEIQANLNRQRLNQLLTQIRAAHAKQERKAKGQ